MIARIETDIKLLKQKLNY